MKTVIEGKIYNTETAEMIHEWENSYGRSDFNWCRECLYKTEKGAWFVAGEGHANSRWAESYGTSRGPGEGIMPLSNSEALDWCETHEVDVDLIGEHFEIDEA